MLLSASADARLSTGCPLLFLLLAASACAHLSLWSSRLRGLLPAFAGARRTLRRTITVRTAASAGAVLFVGWPLLCTLLPASAGARLTLSLPLADALPAFAGARLSMCWALFFDGARLSWRCVVLVRLFPTTAGATLPRGFAMVCSSCLFLGCSARGEMCLGTDRSGSLRL